MGIENHELSNDETLYWQNRLKQRRDSFLQAGDFLKKHTLKDLSLAEAGDISKISIHPADLAGPEQEAETLDSLLEKNLKGIQEIENALERLERGAFGICQSCGEKIPASRLEAIPEARYCLSCQKDMEDMKRATQGRMQKARAATLSTVNSFNAVSVAEVMQDSPVVIRPEEGLDVASQLMFENNIRHLPVVDKRGEIQGVISDRDLLCVFLTDRSWITEEDVKKSWSLQRVSSIMTKTPETATPEMTLQEAGTIMLDNKISCLPVVEGSHLVGIITDTDFVKFVSR